MWKNEWIYICKTTRQVNDIEYRDMETWRPDSSWHFQRCAYSNKIIWPWQTAMKGRATRVSGERGGTSMGQMWMQTETRWLTHKNYTLLKLSGKVS